MRVFQVNIAYDRNKDDGKTATSSMLNSGLFIVAENFEQCIAESRRRELDVVSVADHGEAIVVYPSPTAIKK